MSNQPHQNFTNLEVWKQARLLKNEIRELTLKFPSEEKFRLSDQLIRCSRSINAAIAEGQGRFTIKDQLHFCIIARGSLSETLNHLIDAFDCSYIDNGILELFKPKIETVGKLLNGYINYFKEELNITKSIIG
jgi:four helix bundle protein